MSALLLRRLQLCGQSHCLRLQRFVTIPEDEERDDEESPVGQSQDSRLAVLVSAYHLKTSLVNGALGGTMTGQGAWQPVTTEFAARFLAFIRDPRLSNTR